MDGTYAYCCVSFRFDPIPKFSLVSIIASSRAHHSFCFRIHIPCTSVEYLAVLSIYIISLPELSATSNFPQKVTNTR